jgi:sec-independent protein translocase protein TatA
MLAGLASPSHLILVLVLVLLLFGARRIPELAKGFGTGIKELREGISAGVGAEAPEGEKVRGEDRAGPEDETARVHAGQRGL